MPTLPLDGHACNDEQLTLNSTGSSPTEWRAWWAEESQRAWAELNDRNRPTPQVTIEAVAHAVRERGLGALKQPETIERLSRCDDAAQKQIKERIQRMTERGEIGVGKSPVDEATKSSSRK
jgi:hypothetical protein